MFPLDQPVSWVAPALINRTEFPKLVGKAKYRPPNFADSSSVVNITNIDSGRSEFAQLAYLSFFCDLRLPSDALTLLSAYKVDELTPPPPPPSGTSFDFP